MKCYTCARAGKSTDAVAVCAICGMALCMAHVIRREAVRPVVGLVPEQTMQILCQECSDALARTG